MSERIVGGVGVIDKAVAILESLALADGPLPLSELARRTGIARATAHRLCQSLEQHGLVQRDGDERELGPKLAQLARSVTSWEEQLVSAATPALTKLRDETGESVQLYVRDGDQRRCIAGLESPHGLRTIVRVGAVLPLDVGSAGAILREDEESIRRGWAQSVEEREKGVASVSAPVVHDGKVIAAISVSGPIDRTTRSPGKKYATAVQTAARQAARAIAHS